MAVEFSTCSPEILACQVNRLLLLFRTILNPRWLPSLLFDETLWTSSTEHLHAKLLARNVLSEGFLHVRAILNSIEMTLSDWLKHIFTYFQEILLHLKSLK